MPGLQNVLSRKAGVIVGDDVLRLFEHAQENNYAVPAIVCSEMKLLELSQPGARFACLESY